MFVLGIIVGFVICVLSGILGVAIGFGLGGIAAAKKVEERGL